MGLEFKVFVTVTEVKFTNFVCLFLSVSYSYEFIHCYSMLEAVNADTEDDAAAGELKETSEV